MPSRSSRLRSTATSGRAMRRWPTGRAAASARSAPSLADAAKGIGAALAVALIALPHAWQARALSLLWRRRRLLAALGFALAAVHVVPVVEHLPAFFASGTWADAWRGLGALAAVV